MAEGDGLTDSVELPLKDAVSITIDLDFVVMACDRLLATKDDEKIERMALSMSAVIAYVRCWTKTNPGGRAPLPDFIKETFTAEELELHNRMKRERDKFIAHVEFTREEITLLERVRDARTGEVVGHTLAYKRFTHDPDEVRRLRNLADGVRRQLGKRIHPALEALPGPWGPSG